MSVPRRPRLAAFIKLALPFLGIGASLYLLLSATAPIVNWPYLYEPDKTEKIVASTSPKTGQNHLYIPRINVDVPIVTGSDSSVLELGAWHRKPENGDPIKGGNFVLSAHRFTMGWTPEETRQKSPFFYIDRLVAGDKIYVDYEGERYLYEATRRYRVERTAVEIEDYSPAPKMTLYSCDLRGELAGREVVEAIPLKT